jgi:thioredoxin-like negative regulator of GroEL
MRTPTTLFCTALLTTGALALTGCQTGPEQVVDTKADLPAPVQTVVNEAERAEKPALVVFSATDWCRTCQVYHEQTLDVASTREKIDERVVYQHIDTSERGPGVDAARAMGVNGYPTTVLIVDGRVAASFKSPKSEAELLAWIDSNTG